MQMLFVHMGTDDKGVFPFQKPQGKFVADLVRFFRRDFSRLEGLADLVGYYIVFLFSAGSDSVFPFRQSKLRCRCFGITFVCGDVFFLLGFVLVFGIVDPFSQTPQDGFSFGMVHGNDACCGYRLHLPLQKEQSHLLTLFL